MRIGLIGAGAVAGYHVAAAGKIAGVSIGAICDLDRSAAERVAGAAHGASIYTDYREMYASGEIDAVIVNTPHALHVPMVTEAAQAGLNVLVEKPMATTLAGCDEMITACHQAGVALAVGHIQHFMPDKLAAKAAIDSGRLGEVALVRDYRSTDYRPGSRPDWFLSKRVAGGGAMINIGAHCIDRSLWFAGSDAAEVSASLAHRFGNEVETDGNISLRTTTGLGVAISVVSVPPVRSDTLVVVCEKGVVLTGPKQGALVQVDGKTEQVYAPSDSDIQSAFTAQLEDFYAVSRGSEPAVPLRHARHVLEVVLAGYESDALAHAVALPVVPAALR